MIINTYHIYFSQYVGINRKKSNFKVFLRMEKKCGYFEFGVDCDDGALKGEVEL